MQQTFKAAGAPPRITPIAHSDTRHGITRDDEYAWLRDDNWQEVMKTPDALNADIRAVLEAENLFSDKAMAPYGNLRGKLYEEMRSRIKEDDSTPPVKTGHHAWTRKFIKGGEHPLICRADRDGANEKTVLDGNREAAGESYFKIAATCPCPGNTRLAWAADVKGSEYFTIKVRDVATGEDQPDALHNTSGAMAWSTDAQMLFYIQVDANHRPNKVMLHRLGDPQEADICVYEETDPGFFVGLDATRSGDFIFINIHDHQTSEVRLIDGHHPELAPRTIRPRQAGVEYSIDHDAARQRFTIVTNRDGAVDFQLMVAPQTDPGDWTVLQPHQAGRLLLDAIPYEHHLVTLSRQNALPCIHVTAWETGVTEVLEFSEDVYALGVEEGYEYATETMRFSYSSMTTPEQVFDRDMNTGQRTLVHQQMIPSGHDPADYVCERSWATAGDGAKIPVSLLMHKTTPRDGSAPVLLYGYGSYGITIPAGFSSNRISLTDRGFIYAIAHIRGSKAMGHDWFLQGRGKTKMNTFTDFIAAAEHLIKIGLTEKGNITIHGGSAGGLLVGAAVNLAPELFKAAVAEVPFVDALNTMLDETLPLTPPEWPEWGNPVKNSEDYETIAAYAPYENIKACAYPHILATGGLTDPRVTYWEPAKWVARLRERRTDDGITLLRMEMEAGHGGKAGRYNQLDELAFVYSFVLAAHGRGNQNE